MRGEVFLPVLIIAAFVGQSFGASPIFFQQFKDSTWSSTFKQSSDPKYSGVLEAAIPEGLSEPALKVGQDHALAA